MNDVLHILINDESVGNDSTDPSVFSFFDDLKQPFIQIKNANQLDYLANSLPGETVVAIWVHPNAGIKKAKNVDTPGEASMTALALHEIEFNVVSRYPDDVSKELLSQLDKTAIKLGSLYKEIKNAKTTKISKIKSSGIEGYPNIGCIVEGIDYAIITALEEDEMESVLPLIEKEGSIPNCKHLIEYGHFKSNPKKKVAYASQHLTGMVDASILAAELILYFRPKFLIMAGVLGGKPKDVAIGDVVIATKVFTIDKGKFTSLGFQREMEGNNVDSASISQIRRSKKGIIRFLEDSDRTRTKKIDIHFGSIGCVRQVIDLEGFFDEKLIDIDRKAIALEMESYGITRACELLNEGKTTPLIIKSAMDNTVEKVDDAKRYASWTSATLIQYALEHNLI